MLDRLSPTQNTETMELEPLTDNELECLSSSPVLLFSNTRSVTFLEAITLAGLILPIFRCS